MSQKKDLVCCLVCVGARMGSVNRGLERRLDMFEVEMYRVDGKRRWKVGRLEWRPHGAHNCLLYVEGAESVEPVAARMPADGLRMLLERWRELRRGL